MINHLQLLSFTSSLVQVPAGTVLLERGVQPDCVYFIETGSVVLGIASKVPGELLEHQLGLVDVPGWLEASTGVLGLPSAVDAITLSIVTLRHVSLAEFQAMASTVDPFMLAVLQDMARAHRQQTELAVSRVAKDAEARCAEWLLSHAQSSDKGVCSVIFLQRKRMIAAQLGIAPETLSRALRHLRDRSLISGSGRVVNLVDPSGLRSVAGM